MLGRRPKVVLGTVIGGSLALGVVFGWRVVLLLLTVPCGLLAFIWLDEKAGWRLQQSRRRLGRPVDGAVSGWDGGDYVPPGADHESGCHGGDHGEGGDVDH